MPASLTLADFDDFELLYALEEAGDDEGWASAEEVAQAIGLDHDRPANCVGSRFAWLKRFGLMESTPDRGTMLWRLTTRGRDLHEGKLRAATMNALGGLSEGERAKALDLIARSLPSGSRQGAHLARRAYQHQMGAWRDPKIYRRNGR